MCRGECVWEGVCVWGAGVGVCVGGCMCGWGVGGGGVRVCGCG